MKVLFQITDEDAQYFAKKKIRRKLLDYELERVSKGLEFGLECWTIVMDTAIDEIIEDQETIHHANKT